MAGLGSLTENLLSATNTHFQVYPEAALKRFKILEDMFKDIDFYATKLNDLPQDETWNY